MPQDGLTMRRLAADLAAEAFGPDRPVTGIAPLGEAGESQLTFVVDPRKYAEPLASALRAGAIVLFPSGSERPLGDDASIVVVENPRASFAVAVRSHFAPRPEPGVASTAVVHPTAEISPSAHIGEYSVVGPGAIIGDDVEIRHHVVIAARVRIGAGTLVKSHAVIGEEGFGIDKDADGNNVRLPHLGSVVIGINAEIGNFTTVCSGTISPTTIGDYSKVDDHVHISHNCRIGSNAIITACAEISGSVIVGDGVWIGPNSSIIQGVEIGAGSLVGIGAVVTKSIPANEVQFGNPARRIRDNA